MGNVKTINRENLKIARENIGLSTLAATQKISKSSKNLISDWEKGNSLPTWVQIRELAKLYNISEFLFFSKKKLTKSKSIPDYSGKRCQVPFLYGVKGVRYLFYCAQIPLFHQNQNHRKQPFKFSKPTKTAQFWWVLFFELKKLFRC